MESIEEDMDGDNKDIYRLRSICWSPSAYPNKKDKKKDYEFWGIPQTNSFLSRGNLKTKYPPDFPSDCRHLFGLIPRAK